MTMSETDFVEREVLINASPETIFDFLVDPLKLLRWKGVDVALDPRPGGIFRCNVTGHDIARGEYLAVEPFTRVVFTWGWEEGPLPPGSTTVEISLIPQGEATLVRLKHSGLSGEAALAHAEGWEHFLPRLAIVAEGGDAGPDPWVVPVEQRASKF